MVQCNNNPSILKQFLRIERFRGHRRLEGRAMTMAACAALSAKTVRRMSPHTQKQMREPVNARGAASESAQCPLWVISGHCRMPV